MPVSQPDNETAETLRNMEKRLQKMEAVQVWSLYLLVFLTVFSCGEGGFGLDQGHALFGSACVQQPMYDSLG